MTAHEVASDGKASFIKPTSPLTVANVLLGVLGCAVEGRSAVYISAPITTGQEFLIWRRGLGKDLLRDTEVYRQEHRKHVVEPNLRRVVPIVGLVRSQLGGVVIDPTALEDIPGWSQAHYHGFWTEVVKRFVVTVVFVDGWQYSNGCVTEFVAALQGGVNLLRQDLTPLIAEEGTYLIELALGELDDGVLAVTPMVNALEQLRANTKQAWRDDSSATSTIRS